MISRLRHLLGRDDEGSALLSAVMVGAVLAALSLAVVNSAVGSLRNAGTDRTIGKALGGAEGGLARGLEYLRQGPRALTCTPTCATNPWGNSTTPQMLTFPDGTVARVWIEAVQPFSPPQYLKGTYKIHSVGSGPGGKGTRNLEQAVTVAPFSFPMGIFTDSEVEFSGNGGIIQESLFTTACVKQRISQTSFTGIDSYYGIPAAAHTTSFITTGDECQNPGSAAIHGTDPVNSTRPCNATSWPPQNGSPAGTLAYDQDGYGGLFTPGDACSTAANQYTTTSKFTIDTLTNTYGFRPGGLTPEQYAKLKQTAISQGLYFTTDNPAQITWPNAATNPYPVIYFDLTGKNKTVNIQNQLDSYAWQNDPSCTQIHPSVILVVRGGNLKLTGNSAGFAGAVFVPSGETEIGGTGVYTATFYAHEFETEGNATVGLNDCYVKNTSAQILEAKPQRYRQVDGP